MDDSESSSSLHSNSHALLIVYIHGFKGDDTTFGNFPSRLQHILSETLQGTVIDSVVFPAYETKGDLVRPSHIRALTRSAYHVEQSRRKLCRLAHYPDCAKGGYSRWGGLCQDSPLRTQHGWTTRS